MARFVSKKNAWMVGIALVLATSGARAQAPCTDEQAFQTPGSLTLNSQEQADMNRRFRTKPDPAVRNKIDQTILLLKQSLPDLKGVGGKYWHQIADPSPNSQVLRFWVTTAFFDYYCVPTKDYPPDIAGKVRLSDETGTWIYVYFNTLGWLVNEDVSLGNDMRTASGEKIFLLPRENGEWKGHRVFSPQIHGEPSEAILLTPPGRFPFKPVSRDEFLQAREKVQQNHLDEARAKGGADSLVAKERERQLEEIRKFRASMTSVELQSQAVVREWSGDPSRGRIFASDAEHGLRLVSIDQTYIDKSLPKSAVQLIVVYTRWNEDVPTKREMMRQFESHFDVAALERLLDR
jgi:hypothetical protein